MCKLMRTFFLVLFVARIACFAEDRTVVRPPSGRVRLGAEFGSPLTYSGRVKCSIGRSMEFDGEEITIYPVSVFRDAEMEAWEGSFEDNEEVINRNCLLSYGQSFAIWGVTQSEVYVTAESIDNCFATLVDGERIVVMDPFYLRRLTDTACDRLYALRSEVFAGLAPTGGLGLDGRIARRDDDDALGVRSLVRRVILRHELGHQVFGHTDPDHENAEQPSVFQELCADAYAAYCMGWHGKTEPLMGLAQDPKVAQQVLVEIGSVVGGLYDTTHPNAMRRMTMMREFFARGTNAVDGEAEAPTVEAVAEYLGETHVLQPTAQINRVWVDYNAVRGGEVGLLIHVSLDVKRLRGGTGHVTAYFSFKGGEALRDFDDRYSTVDDKVCVGTTFEPGYDASTYNDLELFIPISQLHLQGGSRHELEFKVELYTKVDGDWDVLATSEKEGFRVEFR